MLFWQADLYRSLATGFALGVGITAFAFEPIGEHALFDRFIRVATAATDLSAPFSSSPAIDRTR